MWCSRLDETYASGIHQKFNEQNELKRSLNNVQSMFLFTKDFDPENKLHSSN